MDIYQISLSDNSCRLLSSQQSAQISGSRARMFFAGFAQDGKTLSEIMCAHKDASEPVAVKKVYGQVARVTATAASATAAGAAAAGAAAGAAAAGAASGAVSNGGKGAGGVLDLYIICNYSQGLDGDAVAQGESFDVTDMDCRALEALCASYQEIEIVAWSFGVRIVRALAEHLEVLRSRIVHAVAVNGTVLSVDMNFGIDPPVYDATLDRFSAVMHKHFVKNMCTYAKAAEIGVEQVEDVDDSAIYRVSAQCRALADAARSTRSVDEYRCELKFMPFVKLDDAPDTCPVSDDFSSLEAAAFYFDEAWVSLGDVIIPPAAQYHYWHSYGLMRLGGQARPESAQSKAAGFTLKLVHAAHLCPELFGFIMAAPERQRPAAV